MRRNRIDTIAELPLLQHKAMERMWLQETGGYSTGLGKKMVEALTAKGLVETNVVAAKDRLGVYQILISRLTPSGHMAYCEWAARQPEETPNE